MTDPAIFLHVLSAIVLMGLVCRLFDLKRCESPALQSRLSWHAWMLAHVLLACGMAARLFGLHDVAPYLVQLGLALMFGIRWARRSSDR